MTSPNDRAGNSTENPPYASGSALVPDGTQAYSPVNELVDIRPESASTENPPHSDGATVLGDAGEPVDVVEAEPQSPAQAGGLHAADVTGLVEPEVG